MEPTDLIGSIVPIVVADAAPLLLRGALAPAAARAGTEALRAG